jgi:hypothetical protein
MGGIYHSICNVLAIVLDFISVHLGEYTLDHAMIDVPIEALSFFAIVFFYTVNRNQKTL